MANSTTSGTSGGTPGGATIGTNDAVSTPDEKLLESLSALMDDEAESLEVRRLVKSMGDTPELATRWRRYHAVRASLQHDVHQRPAVDLLPGIRAALAGDQQNTTAVPAGSIAGRQIAGRLVRVAGQLAIAASVAAAVLVGYPVLVADKGDTAAPQVAAAAATVPAPATESMPPINGDFSASALTRTVSLDEAARDRLEKAVRNFSGTSAVIDAGNTPMFRNQLQPFSGTPVSSPVTPAQSRQ